MRSDDRCVLFEASAAEGPLALDQALPRIGRTRIVVTDYERVVVTYSAREDTVYLFCPPGADPATVLGAAGLVLHDESYRELAWHLGVNQLERAG